MGVGKSSALPEQARNGQGEGYSVHTLFVLPDTHTHTHTHANHAWAAGELCCSRSVLAVSVSSLLSFACLSPVMASRLACNVQPRELWHFIKLRASYSLSIFLTLSACEWLCLVVPTRLSLSTLLACLLLWKEMKMCSSFFSQCMRACEHVCVFAVCIVYDDKLMMGQWQWGRCVDRARDSVIDKL